MVAAWLLIFIASVRELGVSIFLMGPNSKVIAPAIVNSWLSSSSELSAAMALIQTATVFIAVAIMFSLARRVYRGDPMNRPRIEVANLACATAMSPRSTVSASTLRRARW